MEIKNLDRDLLVGGAHAVSLAGPGLSVGQDSHVVALEELGDNPLYGTLVQILVGAVRTEREVIGEGLHWIGIVDENLGKH